MAGRLTYRAVRELFVLLVAATLVGTVVVGVASDRSAAAATTTHRVTIPAAAFRPAETGFIYSYLGGALFGNGNFVAPVPFYRPGDKVQVLNLRLMVLDDSGSDVCAKLRRSVPAVGVAQTMAEACSTGAAAEVRSFQVSVPKPRSVTQWQAAYVTVGLRTNSVAEAVTGVRITYRVVQ